MLKVESRNTVGVLRAAEGRCGGGGGGCVGGGGLGELRYDFRVSQYYGLLYMHE